MKSKENFTQLRMHCVAGSRRASCERTRRRLQLYKESVSIFKNVCYKMPHDATHRQNVAVISLSQ